jgi:hypothetical protein
MPDALDAEHLDLVAVVRATVVHFIEQSRGEAADDFTDHTPFMDAGLDSLDVMKVRRQKLRSTPGVWRPPGPSGPRRPLVSSRDTIQSRKSTSILRTIAPES